MAEAVQVAKQAVREAIRDNLTGEAAKVAFYAFLSLFPLILVLFSLTGLIGGDEAFRWITGRLERTLPPATATYLEGFVREVTARPRMGILSLGLLLTLWSASSVFAALADGLNLTYETPESRSWWKKRLIAVACLAAAAVLLVGGAALLLAGDVIGEALGLGPIWNVLRWPLALVLVTLLLWLCYSILPSRDERGARWPRLFGALIGTLLWIGATLLFRAYIVNFGSYSRTYGAVGAVIVLLLWFYVTSFAILLGGEIAAALERRRIRTGGAPALQDA